MIVSRTCCGRFTRRKDRDNVRCNESHLPSQIKYLLGLVTNLRTTIQVHLPFAYRLHTKEPFNTPGSYLYNTIHDSRRFPAFPSTFQRSRNLFRKLNSSVPPPCVVAITSTHLALRNTAALPPTSHCSRGLLDKGDLELE